MANKELDEYREKFITLRNIIYAKVYKMGSIKAEKILEEEYQKLCKHAVSGDVVAQDFLSYWFKNGSEVVPENIEIGMQWQILAGANGNFFSVEKMFVFLNFAYNNVIFLRDFDEIAKRHGIYKETYQNVLGKLFCDALVDELGITAEKLASQERTSLPFNDISMRKFDKALDRCIPKVIDYLRKT